MKLHAIAIFVFLVHPVAAFAAQPIVNPEDQASAGAEEVRAQRKAAKKAARAQDAKASAQDPRQIVKPAEGRPALTGPNEKPRGLIGPNDLPRALLGPPISRLRMTDGAADSTRRATAMVDSPRPIEKTSFGAPNYNAGEAATGTRQRWRALAEELAFALAGNCVTQLTNPDRAGPQSEEPDPRIEVAPNGGCPALSLLRRER